MNNKEPIFILITPVFDESIKTIVKCLNSVKKQTVISKMSHYLIFDGIKRLDINNEFISSFPYTTFHFLKNNHDDYGDYIRKFGTRLAIQKKAIGIGYLDVYNTIENNHVETIVNENITKKKQIIIAKRKIIDTQTKELFNENSEFFDSNTINFFNERIKIGLKWSKYPRELSLIGDRIISHHLNKYFYSEISLCHTKTVNYSFSKIKIEKINKLKYWYKSNYMNFKHQFNSDFGFDLKI